MALDLHVYSTSANHLMIFYYSTFCHTEKVNEKCSACVCVCLIKGEYWPRMECVNCVVNVARLVGQARPEKPATAFSPESSDIARCVYLSAKDWTHPSLSTSSVYNHAWSGHSVISPVQTHFRRVSIVFFCPSSASSSVCVREGACGLCSLQSTEGGVEELILWRENSTTGNWSYR